MTDVNDRVFTLDELKVLLVPVFRGYNVKRAVLFGSHSKDCATPKSDVDILVDSGLKGRNRIIHDYEGINRNLIWEIIREDLPELLKQLEKL